jgi:hypothetical protein
MTQFQVLSLLLFGVLVAVAYGSTLWAYVKKGVSAVSEVVPTLPTAPPVTSARRRVDDMITVTDLRDRLDEAGCAPGVDACTLLLRAMIDHPACYKKS